MIAACQTETDYSIACTFQQENQKFKSELSRTVAKVTLSFSDDPRDWHVMTNKPPSVNGRLCVHILILQSFIITLRKLA